MTHPRRSRRHKDIILKDLDFADDIALLESSIPRAQKQLSHTSDSAASVGLVINTDKTEFLTLNCPTNQQLMVGPKSLSRVDDFRYLGSMVASSRTDFKKRHGLSWSVFWKLEKIWRSNSVPIHLKIELFKTTCVSVLLYNCETWTIDKEMTTKINSFQTRCFRVILGIKRLDRVSNQHIYETTSSSPLMVMLSS